MVRRAADLKARLNAPTEQVQRVIRPADYGSIGLGRLARVRGVAGPLIEVDLPRRGPARNAGNDPFEALNLYEARDFGPCGRQ